MELLANQIANGVVSGVLYGLLAAGLSILFYVTATVNFAHGEFYVIGGVVAYVVTDLAGMPAAVSILVAPVAGLAVGAVVHLLVRRVHSVDPFNVLLATFAVSLLISNLVDFGFAGHARSVSPLLDGRIVVFGVVMTNQRIAAATIALVVLVALAWWLKLSTTGRLLRAVADNRNGAAVLGIGVVRIDRLAFALSGLLAALGGALLAPITQVTAFAGMPVLVKAFVVLVIAGIGSISGALVAGIGLGVLEGITASTIGNEWIALVGYVALLVALFARPWLESRRRVVTTS